MILISEEHNEDRLAGTLFNLMRGPNPAKIRIYDDSGTPERPAAITDAPVGVLLAVATLLDPPGVVEDNKLTLSLPPDALVLATGTARWARISTGEDSPSLDCDVSLIAGAGELKLLTIDLLAGGAVRLVSAEFG